MKCVIVINGSGGCGKDTIVKYVASKMTYRSILNASSIDSIKKAAKALGWIGNKTPKSRKFLYDLKQLSIQYNDNPTYQLIKHIKDNRADIYFFHIRESEEIDKIKNKLEGVIDVVTWIVRRQEIDIGNPADDDVYGYWYDYHIDNSGKFSHTIKQVDEILREMEMIYEIKCDKTSFIGSRKEYF